METNIANEWPVRPDTPKTSTRPDGQSLNHEGDEMKEGKIVKILYFTDPFCTASFGMAPHLRQLTEKYSHHFSLEYKMGGLMPLWEVYRNNGISTFEDMARHWQAIGLQCGVPTNGSVWLTDPPRSSFPASIAFKAAQLQSEQKALIFFHRLGEMVFIENKNISRSKLLWQAAEECGLDAMRLSADHVHKGRHLFEEDLLLAEKMSVLGFPSLHFKNDRGHKCTLEGYQHYELLEEKLLGLIADGKV